jgi:hypothetical protein
LGVRISQIPCIFPVSRNFGAEGVVRNRTLCNVLSKLRGLRDSHVAFWPELIASQPTELEGARAISYVNTSPYESSR